MSLIKFLNKVVKIFNENKFKKSNFNGDEPKSTVLLHYNNQLSVQIYKGNGLKTIYFEISPDQSNEKTRCRTKESCCYVTLSFYKYHCSIGNVGCKEISFVDLLMTCALYVYTIVDLNLKKPLTITDSAEKDGKSILLYNAKNILDGKRDLDLGLHYYEKWGFNFSIRLQNLLFDAIKKGRSEKYISDNFFDQEGYWYPVPKSYLVKKLNLFEIPN